MKLIKPVSLPSTWSVLTVVLLAIIFCYYYFVIVKEKEDYLVGRNFRVLNRINDNLNKTNNNLIKNARNIFDYSKSTTQPAENGNNLAYLYKAYGTDIINATYHQLSPANEDATGRVDHSDIIYYDDQHYLDYNLPTRARDSAYYSLSFRFPFRSLIDQSLVKDVFEEFLVIHNGESIFNSSPVILNKNRIDSLLQNNISKLSIDGKSYKTFTQPSIMKIDGKELYLIGLTGSKKFNNEKYSISVIAVIIIFLIFFLLALGYPFFKLRLIGPLERIIAGDVIQALVSFVLGSSVLTIVAISVLGHFEGNHGRVSKELNELSRQINDSLDFELKEEILPQLATINRQLEANDVLPNRKIDNLDLSNFTYKNIELVFWMNAQGLQKEKWSATALNTPFIDVSKRDYFKRIINGNFWRKDKYNYYLQSIKSWNTGKNYAVVSTPSPLKGLPVSAVSVELHSLNKALLPYGFGFAIIDERGEVWFHSDEHKNLQENFIEECDQNEDLRALLFSKRSGQIDAKYHGSNFFMQVSPVKDTSLTLVTFADMGYYRVPFDQIISLTFLLNLFLFVFIFLLFFGSRVVDFYPRKLASNNFDFTLFRPTVNRSFRYIFGICINAFNLLILISLTRIFYATPALVIFLLVTSCLYQVMFLYFIMKKDSFARLWLYRKLFPQNKNLVYDDQIDGFLIVVSSLIVAVNLFAFFFLIDEVSEAVKIIAYQGIQALFFVAMFFENKMPKIKYRYLKLVFKNYKTNHNLFFVSSIIFISVFPAYKFYQIANDYELDHFIKHAQIQLANDVHDRNQWIENKFANRNGIEEKDLEKFRKRGLFVKNFYQTELIDKIPDQSKFVRGTDFDSIFSYLRIPYHQIIKDTKYLKLHSDSINHLATFYLFNEFGDKQGYSFLKNDRVAEKIILNYVSHDHVSDTLKLASTPNRIHFSDMKIFDSYLITITLVLSGIIFFFILFKFGLRRYLGTDIRQNRLSSKFDTELIGNWFENKNLFIIVPPYTKKETLENKLTKWISLNGESGGKADRANALKPLDLAEHPAKEGYDAFIKEMDGNPEEGSTCILYHLESTIRSREDRDMFMDFLEKLIYHKKVCSVIITSLHHTRKIQELIHESEQSDLKEFEVKLRFARWKMILSGFWKVYYPFQSKSNRKFKRQTEPLILASHDLLEYELSASEYLETIKSSLGQSNLYKMEAPVNSDRQTISFKEDIILKVQSLAGNYYHALWSSCSKTEKYAMYDLAVDGLVNTKNREAIYMLMNKGILIKRGTLKFMNESFRNFILTIINPDDEFKMQMEINRVGTWAKFRTPILLIIIGAAFFIAFTQEAVFNKILAGSTSVLALVPLVLKLNTILGARAIKSDKLD
ncbi:cache domain-containing protein [Fulvivirgaceae bacterium BMA12]|uniref:Cache domain-containing protein n=1 Tax=Agaribacillus aureus TaxID=3051825 RepID=A0ABT8KZU6_9BACT|nr:cache domain-containing protein [Fulvivirgaceae bacterium BMA12]